MTQPSLAARLRQAFLDDLDEQLAALNADLLGLEADGASAERLKSLFRAAHTLKGAARAASLPAVEQLCHALEETLSRARDGALALGPGHFRLLVAAADALAATGRGMRAGGEPDASALAPLTAALQSSDLPDLPSASPSPSTRPNPAAPSGSTSTPASSPSSSPSSASIPAPATSGPQSISTGSGSASSAEAAPSAPGERDGRVRVEAARLDELLAGVERLLLARARLEDDVPEARALADRLARAAAAARGTDAAAPLREMARDADRLASSLAADLRALKQASGEVAGHARRTRMRPFAEACEALPRAVRDVAAASGKEARVVVRGGAVEADRAVIDAVREALLHIARNAVDHGIEPPEERVRAGKPRQGTVTVSAALRGEQIAVTVTDDGRGLDLGAIRAALSRLGQPIPEDDRDVARALFESGLSTRVEADEISGRGVGLDAARAAVERVRGTVRVEWSPGAGTAFALECPLTLAAIRALLVRVGGHAFAIPSSAVDRLARVDPATLRRAGDREVLLTGEGPVPIVPLARVLGPPLEERAVRGPFPAVQLRFGERRLVVAVDEPEGEGELVVRSLRHGRAELPHLSGAALLGSGEVALVLNVAAVVASGLAAPGEGLRVEAAPERARRRVLVVDDSITTRTLEQSTLEAAGYEVAVAVDGEDGWRMLQEGGADLVISDVEMPRMDGIELTVAIRASRRFAELPVILVTSLESPEHRARGMEAGADAYVAKSAFDQEGLLDTVRRLLG